MALFETLTDTFDGPSLDAGKWPNGYADVGSVSVVNGHVRVPCSKVAAGTSGYASAVSGSIYTLSESFAAVEVITVPAETPTAQECYCTMAVRSPTAGTYVEIMYNAVTGNLRFQDSRNGNYWDDAAPTVAFDPVAHRWWKLALYSGTLTYETSPDGLDWTVQRTISGASVPGYLTNSNLPVTLEAGRNRGANDYAEFDNFNVLPVVDTGPEPGRFFLAYQ